MAVQFRKEALNRFSAPEELKDNVTVANPRIVLGLIGVSLCFVGCLIWVLFGYIIISTGVEGICKNDTLTCFSQTNDRLQPGMEVLVGGKSGVITSVSETPISRDVIAKSFEDYEMYSLDLAEFEYVIKVDIKNAGDGIKSARIVQARVHPVSLVFEEEV